MAYHKLSSTFVDLGKQSVRAARIDETCFPDIFLEAKSFDRISVMNAKSI